MIVGNRRVAGGRVVKGNVDPVLAYGPIEGIGNRCHGCQERNTTFEKVEFINGDGVKPSVSKGAVSQLYISPKLDKCTC